MSREFMIRWKSRNVSKPFHICKTMRMIFGVFHVVLGVFFVKFLMDRRAKKRKP